MELISDAISITCIIVGIISLLKYSNRKFNRTNAYGVEKFTSYSVKVKSKVVDGFLVILAVFFTTYGVMMLAFHYQESWGWVVIIPAMLILYGIWIPGRR